MISASLRERKRSSFPYLGIGGFSFPLAEDPCLRPGAVRGEKPSAVTTSEADRYIASRQHKNINRLLWSFREIYVFNFLGLSESTSGILG
jgi:hypothetical protein